MIKISQRSDLSKKKIASIRVIAILFAVAFAGVFIAILGFNPIKVYSEIILGALGTARRFKATINIIIPLVITSLGILVAFKMKFWNIGGEGQIMMGAFSATYVALNYGALPQPILLLLMALASIIGGAIWAFIPAFFKIKMGTNETIFTLMMNYIAIKWITYLQYGPWRDPNSLGFPKVANFGKNAILPEVLGVHMGWIIMLILIAIIYVFMNHSKKGFEVAVIGESINTAKYAGMNVPVVIGIGMLLSGGLCGLTGMIQASAIERTLNVSISSGYGFTAIITTWLSGLRPSFILLTSFFFAIMIQGGIFIQTALKVPNSAADMIQGIVLFFVLGSEFFIQYRISFKK